MRLEPDETILFFDMREIEGLYNLELLVEQAEKHPLNPLFPFGDMSEWDSGRASPWGGRSVIYDEEESLFKMWYGGTDAGPREKCINTGYAVSHDGIAWEKLHLNLVEWGGSKRNNICAPFKGAVIKDRDEPDPARRYKMFVKKPPDVADKMAIAYSPDGLHWGDMAYLDLGPWGGTRFDIVLLLKDDQDPDPRRRYKMIWQNRMPPNKRIDLVRFAGARPPEPETVRAKSLAYGPDETTWTPSPDNPILSPDQGLEQENHFLMYIPYQGQYVMLYECGWYHPDGRGRFGTYTADIRLAHSRDGEHFDRILPDQIAIPRGRHGEWDDQFLVISDKAVIRDGTIYLYYSGQNRSWTSWPPDNSPEESVYATGTMRPSQPGVATLKLDRFSGLGTCDGERPGCALTKSFDLTKLKNTVLNVNLSRGQPYRSWGKVEILDGAGKIIPGFSRDDCRVLADDAIRLPVSWAGGSLRDVSESEIRLRFWLCGPARLHSFCFKSCQ